ncbi:MAG TPA: DMT family transporter [Clostridia bacterium]|nr:DMT family transporter [Clostridia bacterium]
MYAILALLGGALIAGMVALNGALSTHYGVYSATAIIHLAGLIFILPLCLLQKGKLFHRGVPFYLYLGGALGVPLTICNNVAFARISVSSMLALGLFAQSVAGIAMDKYGLMGMPKRAFGAKKLFGLALTLAGIAVMTDTFDAVAVFVSLLAGVLLIVARTLNARLAERTSLRAGTFFNYLVGLATALPVCLLLGRGEPAFTAFAFSPKIWMYLGGIVGACVVLILNFTVTRVSAFSLSLFLFIGQVFAGLLIDALFLGAFTPRLLAGGLLVAAGLVANVIMERNAARREPGGG